MTTTTPTLSTDLLASLLADPLSPDPLRRDRVTTRLASDPEAARLASSLLRALDGIGVLHDLDAIRHAIERHHYIAGLATRLASRIDRDDPTA